MPTIDLQQVYENLYWTVAEETLTPSEAYTEWAVDLGLSPTQTLYSLSADNSAWVIDLGIPFWTDSTQLKAMWSSEAGIGLYTTTPTNTTLRDWTIPEIYKFRGIASTPTLLISWHPNDTDLISYTAKANRTSAATILFSQYEKYNRDGTSHYDVAIKIMPGCIELVGRCVNKQTNIIATEITEPATTVTVRQQRTLLAQAIGTTRRLTLTLIEPAMYRLSSNAKFTDGAIPTKLRIWDHASGTWIADLTPDQATGAYLFNIIDNDAIDLTIYRTGYRPLTHGPVTPVKLP